MTRRNLNRAELILALSLYFKLPFGLMDPGTQKVIHLANILGRTPSSIGMKLANFECIDRFYNSSGIGGLSGAKKGIKSQ